MKSVRTFVLLSSVIPLALIAQSGQASSSGSGPSRTGSGQTDSHQTRSGQSGSINAPGMNSPDSMAAGSASRVTKDSLKSQVTAKKLLGEDVYDNGGKKIGSVEDIVFHGSGSSLSGAFVSQSSASVNRGAGGSMSGSGAITRSEPGSSGVGTTSGAVKSRDASAGTPGSGTGSTSGQGSYAGSSSGSGTSGMSGASTGSRGDWSARSGSSARQEPAVIIASGGFAGMGGTMIRLPLSQLSYDSGQDRLTVDMSEMELSQLKDSGDLAVRSDK